MDAQSVKENASSLKSIIRSRRNSSTDIFYNIHNYSEILTTNTYSVYTPLYHSKLQPTLAFRGFMRKDYDQFTFGLELIPSIEAPRQIVVKWSLCIWHALKCEYLQLGLSRFNSKRSDTIVSKIEDVNESVENDSLLLKWNIEVITNDERAQNTEETDDKTESLNDVYFENAIDTLISNLHTATRTSNDDVLSLKNVQQGLAQCAQQQQKVDAKLNEFQKQTIAISDRLTCLLDRMDVYTTGDHLTLCHCCSEEESVIGRTCVHKCKESTHECNDPINKLERFPSLQNLNDTLSQGLSPQSTTDVIRFERQQEVNRKNNAQTQTLSEGLIAIKDEDNLKYFEENKRLRKEIAKLKEIIDDKDKQIDAMKYDEDILQDLLEAKEKEIERLYSSGIDYSIETIDDNEITIKLLEQTSVVYGKPEDSEPKVRYKK
ncbi:uncharacterized protein LOC106077260 isoform X3 [Biomphalaria glabrata]|uniref:Uncharacterized protein LOC106077260 isoform X3 n=1 Tax=Biomphalaria glabrata TaxID=6526 RepID=A0A9W2Z6J4_BIOGL|nr:uncharacterized protein LOC106077260 isoform X3 [Biomphalaria glabrata]